MRKQQRVSRWEVGLRGSRNLSLALFVEPSTAIVTPIAPGQPALTEVFPPSCGTSRRSVEQGGCEVITAIGTCNSTWLELRSTQST